MANNEAEHLPRAAAARPTERGQKQSKAPSNVGSVCSQRSQPRVAQGASLEGKAQEVQLAETLQKQGHVRLEVDEASYKREDNEIETEQEKHDFRVAKEKWPAQHKKPNRQEQKSSCDLEDSPRLANRQHVYLEAKPEAHIACLTSPKVEVHKIDKPAVHSSASSPLDSSQTCTVPQHLTPLSQGGAAGIGPAQAQYRQAPLAQPQLSGKHLNAEINQLQQVNQAKRNGIDNQAFEIEEDNITESNSFNEQRKKGRKGLGSYLSQVSKPINATEDYIKSHAQTVKYILLGVLGAGYVAYFIAACVLNFQRAIALVVLTTLAVVFKSYELLKKYKGESISEFFSPAVRCFNSNLRWIKWVFMLTALVLLVVWLVLDTSKRTEQLISFGGVCLFVFLLFLFSSNRTHVSWRPVLWGLGMQFCMGIFVIRTQPGLLAFEWLGNQVKVFLEYTKAGSSFVFGNLIDGIFAFTALPIVVFFSSVMSILYFLGIMQWLILKISWIMQITMGTSPTETLSVAGNIFVGQTEAPLLIRPYLKDMTKSEIHAVMVGGFATIAGSVLGTFILFGIDPASLIAASVMAAPCALAISKLSYPETEESKFKAEKNIKIAVGDEKNILEAASAGASASIGLVANIAVNLIAFLAILAFINEALSWLGGMVGYPSLTFQLICSYVFMPVAFMMGVPYEDAFVVAELLGIKLFINEFVAYEKLSEMKKIRLSGLDKVIGGETQWIYIRSEIISTYALCGFANLSSLGIVIGGLSAICPSKRSDISLLVFRAMITGTCVSLVNACIAGILFVPPTDCVGLFSGSDFNGTDAAIQNCCQDLFKSSVNNGTVSFEGFWSTVANATVYFTKCCQCCGVSNGDLCI